MKVVHSHVVIGEHVIKQGGAMNRGDASLPPVPPRTGEQCLRVSPALMDVCVFGWRDLAALLLQAEERERLRVEREERLSMLAISCSAEGWRCAVVEERVSEEDAPLVSCVPQTPSDLSASPLPPKKAAQACTSTSTLSATSALTPYQRFCFTRSTVAKYRCTAQKPQRLLSRATSPAAPGAAALPSMRSVSHSQHNYVHANICAAETPSPRAGPTTLAAMSSPRRDLWSWSSSRARDTPTPPAAPTPSRRYGSAARRAVSMALIFDRLSYEGKALVARQAELLGLLLAAPSASVSGWDAPHRGQPTTATAAATPLTNVDATALNCAGAATPTTTDCHSEDLSGAAGQRSPAPVSAL
ncbi:hypothetical protein ABB37_00326 [Leptomonas pyrrhocoris]|uniref:Uncharacterized protein n=1 Tax=Leptomonas pyrrhocoris TaxID=157538 RepID=A0A0M9GAA5_LEPPY|nr:hypothetical protein ABB37_00326 [Leptomonas pyrrhocoris]KPA86057.1 hypothetical protein ABB37_00326 [Leptomonas pyrrhocoris]|eukprot:XP_015664496.1 hypothetical protein ABB37_00326 [Leptomonas pyrrhocoris]